LQNIIHGAGPSYENAMVTAFVVVVLFAQKSNNKLSLLAFMLASQQYVRICKIDLTEKCPHCCRLFMSEVDIELDRQQIGQLIEKLRTKLSP
jgi:hypothetical protein